MEGENSLESWDEKDFILNVDKHDRFQQLHRIFTSHRYPVQVKVLAEEMECSQKTVSRSIQQLRDYYHAPLEYDVRARGWHYNPNGNDQFELPGLWLTGEELQSLTLLLHVLKGFGSGLLNQELGVIETHIHKLLEARGICTDAFAQHLKYIPLGTRQLTHRAFAKVGEALLNNRRVQLQYSNFNGEHSQREVSPQSLVYYRENWYLDAWCHLRKALRTFSIARIERAQVLKSVRKIVPNSKLKAHFSRGYGIFAGRPTHTARLRFLPAIAREIASQQWHPAQQAEWEGETYRLSFPYSDERELVQDILRHAPNVIVEGPEALRTALRQRLREALVLHAEPEKINRR